MRSKRLPKIIISQLCVGLIMLMLGLIIVFFAQGYRFNTKSFRIIKTGVLFVVTNQKEAAVYINGKLQSNKTPFAQNLSGGYYDVEIKKDSYVSWHNSARIEPELVTDYKNIILFKDKIKPQILTDSKKISLLDAPIDVFAVNAQKELSSNDYEIWVDDKLVTRLSRPILRLKWYPDLYHILYQQGNSIRIMEIDGTNDTLLVELEQSYATTFTTGNKGEELYYLDNGQIKMATIK